MSRQDVERLSISNATVATCLQSLRHGTFASWEEMSNTLIVALAEQNAKLLEYATKAVFMAPFSIVVPADKVPDGTLDADTYVQVGCDG